MVAPLSSLSLPIHYLRETIAFSPAFQAWTGSADEVEARARIHTFGLQTETPTLPLAVVDYRPGGSSRELVSRGSRNHFTGNALLEVMFLADVTEVTNEDAAFEFMNEVGAVRADMEDLFGTAGFLDAHRTELVDGPSRPTKEERATAGDVYWAIFEIEARNL